MFDAMDETARLGYGLDFENDFGVTRRSGLLHHTSVATPGGWQDVEAIRVGDRILTFDHGYQAVTALERVINWPDHKTCPDHAAPFEVPAGALCNADQIWMLPNQLVVVESDTAEALTGDPFALLTVEMLNGWKGICRVAPRAPHLVVILHFARDQVIYAGDGALVFAQAERSMLSHAWEQAPYVPLDRAFAQAVADELRAQEVAAA